MTDSPAAGLAAVNQTIAQDANALVAKVEYVATEAWDEIKAGVNYLSAEGEAILHWVDANVPGGKAAIQGFVTTAEADATNLAKLTANGLETAIANGGTGVEAVIKQYLSDTGQTVGQLKSAGLAATQTILGQLVNVGLAKVLGAVATAAIAAA